MKKTLCVYCNKLKHATNEHVVPTSLFSKRHGVVIPVCFQCNNGKSKDDEYFRLVFSVLNENRDQPVAKSVLEKVKRSLKNPKQEKFRSLLSESSANEIELQDDGSEKLNTGLMVELNRVNKTLELITKGLYFLETESILGDNYLILGCFGKEDNSIQSQTFINRAKQELVKIPWKSIGDDEVFKYRVYFPELNAPQSIWEFKIYYTEGVHTLISKTNK